MTVRTIQDYSELRVGQHITLYAEHNVDFGVITGVQRRVEPSGVITALINISGSDSIWEVPQNGVRDIVIYKEAELEGEEVLANDIKDGDLIAVHNIMSSEEWLDKASDEELRAGLIAMVRPEKEYVELYTPDGKHYYTLAVSEGWAELRRLKKAEEPRRGHAIHKHLLLRGDLVDIYLKGEDGSTVGMREHCVQSNGGSAIIESDEFRLVKSTQVDLKPYPITREQAIHRAPIRAILLGPGGEILVRVEGWNGPCWAEITENYDDFVDVQDEELPEGDYTVLHWPAEEEDADD